MFKVPDARTIRLFQEALKEHDLVDELFAGLNGQMRAAGYTLRQGQIVEACMVAAPRRHNTRDENARIRQGETPGDREAPPDMLRQKGLDARWTRKQGKTHYSYRNHMSVDRKHKPLRHVEVTSASVADNPIFDVLLDPDNTGADVRADGAYGSKAAREQSLKNAGYRSHIHTKGQANRPLRACQQRANLKRSRRRCRVEHVFAAQQATGGYPS